MAITAYCGFNGSGKSYSVFEKVILPALRNKREVWTNIPFYEDRILEDFGIVPTTFTFEDIESHADWFHEVLPKGAVIVMDELMMLWPSGMKANNAVQEHKEFLTMHRHLVNNSGQTTEIVFCCQSLNQIASFARELVSATYLLNNLENVGKPTSFRLDVYTKAVNLQNPLEKQFQSSENGEYLEKVYKYYKSATGSDTGTVGNEARTDDSINIYKSSWLKKTVLVIAIGVPICAYMFYYSYMSLFPEPLPEPVKSVDSKASDNSVTSPVGNVKPRKPVQPKKPKKPDLLAGFQLDIDWVDGSYPNFTYVITARNNDGFFRMEQIDFMRLGYVIKPHTECLATITVNEIVHIATCAVDDTKTIVENTVAGTRDAF